MNSTHGRADPMQGTQEPPGRRRGILGWIVAHPKTTLALSLLLSLVLAGYLLDAVAEQRLQRQLDAIRATGAPVTVDDLNDAMPDIPDDENMALRVFEHVGKTLLSEIPHIDAALLPLLGKADPPASAGQHLPEEQIEMARRYLDAISEPLAEIHEALRLERGCLEVKWVSPACISTLFASRSECQQLAKVLALEATVAVEHGHVDRAGRIILDILHFEGILDYQGDALAALTQMAIHGIAQNRVVEIINLSGLSEPVLGQIQAKLQEIENKPDLKKTLLTERVIFIDNLECVRSSGGLTAFVGGSFSALNLWRYVPALPELDESEGLTVMTALVESIDGPSATLIKRVKAAEANSATLAWYCVISRMGILSCSTYVSLWLRNVGENRATQAGLACERYRLVTGGWPETLDDLVPLHLEAVPIDPFDGKLIRYAHIVEGIKVWSIGMDLADGGGDVGRLARKGNARPADRGWVLLNPDLRGRPAERPED